MLKPIPKDAGVLSLTIIRKNTGFNKLFPKYTLVLDSTEEFILNAKKRAGNKLSNYLISTSENEFDKTKESFVAKLRACQGKYKYIIYNNGENFFRNTNVGYSKLRNELGAIIFKNRQKKLANMTMKDFDNLLMCIPAVDITGNQTQFKPYRAKDSIINLLEQDICDNSIIKFDKKCPLWSEKKNSFVLNFGKRIKQASVKNTQLIRASNVGFETDSQIYFQVKFGIFKSIVWTY